MSNISVIVNDSNNITAVVDQGVIGPQGPIGPPGPGDVDGPASATDNAVARFDGTTGKLIQNSVVLVSDTGAVSGVTDLTASGAVTLSGGTANGVAYLNGSKVLTTGSALTFDGTNFASTGIITSVNVNGLRAQYPSSAGYYAQLDSRDGNTHLSAVGSTAAIVFKATDGPGTTAEGMRLTSTGLEVKQSQLIGYSSYASIGTNGLAVAGNVGIGTSSPTAKLQSEVSGSTAQLKLTQTSYASYNFKVTTGSALTIDKDGTLFSTFDSSGNLTLTGNAEISGAITEAGSPVVVQSDIGTAANEIPLNQYLGSMAYQDGTNYYNVGMTMGFRNRIINGAMIIDQRNAGASITPTDNQYSVDRWACRLNQASKYSAQQNAGSVTPPSGYTNYLGVTSLSSYSVASGDYFFLNQAIEGFNIVDLAWGTANAKSITLSFQIYSSLTGTFGASICNSGGTRVYPFSYTVSSANTWTSVSVTVAGDTTGTWLTTTDVGIAIRLGLGCGSTFSGGGGAWTSSNFVQPANTVSVVGTNGATFYITGVQFEVGTQATPFDWRPYGTELQLCQRYFEKSIADGTAATAITGPAPTLVAVAFTTTSARTQVFYKTPKRATPTLTTIPSATVGTGNQWGWFNGGWSGGATTVAQQNANAFSVDITGTYTAFNGTIIDGNWYASAEL